MWIVIILIVAAFIGYQVWKKKDAEVRRKAADKAQFERILMDRAEEQWKQSQRTSAPIYHPSSQRMVPHIKTPTALSYTVDAATFDTELSAIPSIPILFSDSAAVSPHTGVMPEIKLSNITRQTNMKKFFPIVVIDTETTGVKAASDEIIELSAIKYDYGFVPISSFSCLLKPTRSIPPAATAVNNITNEMVENCPSVKSVLPCFSDFISGCNIVGHNLKFDMELLYRAGLELNSTIRYYDTLRIARYTLISYRNRVYDHRSGRYLSAEETGINVDDFKLVTLCDYYNIHRTTAHRSLSDCHATAKVLECLIADKTQPV